MMVERKGLLVDSPAEMKEVIDGTRELEGAVGVVAINVVCSLKKALKKRMIEVPYGDVESLQFSFFFFFFLPTHLNCHPSLLHLHFLLFFFLLHIHFPVPNANIINVDSSFSCSFLRQPATPSWPLSSSSSFKLPSDRFVPKAAAESASENRSAGGDVLLRALKLGALFGLWIIFNIYFNIYNKQVLKVYHFPITVTAVQFAVGAALVSFMWCSNLYKRPNLSSAQLAAILPLAVVHTLGNLFTNMSLGKVAVSFTHTIKAMEPFFSVILSAMFLREMPTALVIGSLVPIAGGVALASATEASFNWTGFWSAMASNLSNQSRNVLSKKLMVKEEESMDNITLFSIITVMSFLLTAPLTLIMEGFIFTPAYLHSAGLNVKQVYIRSLLAAFCFHAYQQVAYMILQWVSPVTHSVANCAKRVVVIVSSVLFFRTPVSLVNAIGTAIALAGVFFYSRVTRTKPKTT